MMKKLYADFESIARGQHRDPFSILGPHSGSKYWCVRSWQPQAHSVELVDSNDNMVIVDSRKQSDYDKGHIPDVTLLVNTETNADTLAASAWI